MDTKAKHLLVVAAMMIMMLLSLSSAAGAVDTPAVGSQDTAITQFSDVTSNNNAIYINYLADLKIINGYPDGTYHPQEGLTRAQAAVIIAKAARLATPPALNSGFSDVKADHWAAPSIAAAAQAGYLKGYPDGSYHPDQTLTRAQGISLIMRISSQKERNALPKLKDMNADHWAAADMGTALAAGMIGLSADGSQVYPDQPLTRGSLARALGTLLTQDPGLYKQPLAGAVKQVTGEITILRDGKKSPAQNDSPVYQGDTITTGKGSSVNITYPDGSSVLVKENSEIFMKESVGRACMKKDGKSGMAVESVDIDLKQGSIFGALATKHEQEEKEQARAGKNLVAALGSRYLAEAQPAQPWYKEASAKKVKMKVDMPWGVAAVRGTFILVSLAPDGSCNVSCLTGDAQVQANSGGTVTLSEGLKGGLDNKGNPAPSAPMGEKEVQAFEDVQQWLVNTALQMDQNKEANAPLVVEIVVGIPTAPVQKVEQAKAIEVVLDALKSSGIQLNEQVKRDLEQKLKESQEVQKIEDISTPEQNTQTNAGGGGTANSSGLSYINYSTAGTYGPTAAGSQATLNNVIISAAGVTLQNVIITRDLTLAAGIGDGNVTLKNVKVLGNTLVYGGGPNSIHIENCELYKVIVDNKTNTVRIVAQGNTSVGALTLNSGAKLEESGLEGSSPGFSDVESGVDLPEGAEIVLCGSFGDLVMNVPGISIALEGTGSSIGNITIDSAAGGCEISLGEGTSVSVMEVSAALSVCGSGSIESAVINAEPVVLEQAPASITVADGLSATIGSVEVKGHKITISGTLLETVTEEPLSGVTVTAYREATEKDTTVIPLTSLSSDIQLQMEGVTGVVREGETTSSTSGAFGLSVTADCVYCLVFTKDSVVTVQAVSAGDSAKALGEVSMRTTAGIYGMVTNSSTNDIISGAQLNITGMAGAVVASATGSYSFTGLAAGSYTVQVNCDGYLTASVTVSCVAGQDSECNILLTPANGGFYGKITNLSSSAIAGAVLSLCKGESYSGSVIDSVYSADDGSYSFSGLSPGYYSVQIAASGYTTTTFTDQCVAGQNISHNVTISSAPGSIYGTVSDSLASPISGAILSLVAGENYNGTVIDSVYSNNDGSYSFSGLTAGYYTVQVSASGYSTSTFTAQSVAGQNTNHNVTLTDLPGGIYGTINNASASPISGAYISLCAGKSYSGTVIDSVYSTNAGSYSFSGLSPGYYTLEVNAADYAATVCTTLCVSGQNTEQNLVLYSDYTESSDGWTLGGLWNFVSPADSLPQNTAVPTYVQLPAGDTSNDLPQAFFGSKYLWYGSPSTGNYIGTQSPNDPAGSGGTSTGSNTGTALSPLITVPATTTYLQFNSWWEIEGVEPTGFDLMDVQVVCGGSTHNLVGLNPSSGNGGSNYKAKNYSSAGALNSTPVWKEYSYSLEDYAGQSIQLKFIFNTKDGQYNGFRGWCIDNLVLMSAK